MVLLAGLACGYVLSHLVAAPYHDCGQSSPGFASLGTFAMGVVVVLVIMVPVLVLVYVKTPMPGVVDWLVGSISLPSAAIAGVVGGFLLHVWLWGDAAAQRATLVC